MRRWQAGFSLAELLIVITIISVLGSVLFIDFNQGSQQSRDTQRKSDIREIQSAVELYKNRYGRYPEGCNTAGNWSGQRGSGEDCSDGSNEYIRGLAPEFIPTLPVDPRPDGNPGYMYSTNADGSVFIFKAKETVESEVVTLDNPFRSCATNGFTGFRGDVCDVMSTNLNSGNRPNHCNPANSTFQTSYGVWGGWAEVEPFGYVIASLGGSPRAQEETQRILCMLE